MAAPTPLLVERFRGDLEALAPPRGAVAVAVSGGPDSLALLLLAAAAFPQAARAATVDHGLRPESAAEAALAAAACARLGVPHRILKVEVERRGEGLQAAARSARYRALGGWMREEGLGLLLTAHHADDQAETLLMRLMRGSGVAGLAGVRARIPFPAGGSDALLCRPLLAWRREELAEIVRAAGLKAADDPSNRDEAYDRARLRARLAEAPWIEPEPLARSAATLAEAEEALQWVAEQSFAECVGRDGHAVVLAPEGLPAEILRRLVLRCLRETDADAAPRGHEVTRLIETLRGGGAATLAGVRASGAGPLWRFEPAPPRREVG